MKAKERRVYLVNDGLNFQILTLYNICFKVKRTRD